MNVYTVKGVSYSEVEANSKEEAIEEYKENILEYICDNWEVIVVNDGEKDE
jgi:glycosyltransferase involved in cell wall biosynthesis|tara:strand:+ start:203 stop:355 length:153 start_codon:yes stop_codon:yes gene_type:complete